MYLSSGLLCLTLPSSKRSAVTQIPKLNSPFTSRHHKPSYSPPLRLSICLPQGLDFREFLFTKLINAEYACYKAEKFAKLEVRRVLRCTLRYRSMNACSVFVCVCVCVRSSTRQYAKVCILLPVLLIVSDTRDDYITTHRSSKCWVRDL